MTRVHGWSEEELERRADGLAALVRRVWRSIAQALGRTVTARGTTALDSPDVVTAAWHDAVVDGEIGEYVARTYVDSARDLIGQLDLPDDVLIGDDPVRAYLEQATNRLVDVGDDVWNLVRDQVAAGIDAGESVSEVAARVRNVAGVSHARSLVIARTETHAAHEAGSYAQALLVDPDATKEWLATSDTRTRETHRRADGQRVRLSQPFAVGGVPLHFPGDPAGPPHEVINCRCSVAYDFDTIVDVTSDADEPEDALVAAGARKWKPEAHPRGKDGKFIKKGALSDLLSAKTLTVQHAVKAALMLDEEQWSQLTGAQKDYVKDKLGKLPPNTASGKLAAQKLEKLEGVSSTKVTDAAVSAPSPIKAHKGAKPGTPAKVTTTLIWDKHDPGTTILERPDGETRVTWNGKKYDVQTTKMTGDWVTTESLTKKDVYGKFKGDDGWVVPGLAKPKAPESTSLIVKKKSIAKPVDASAPAVNSVELDAFDHAAVAEYPHPAGTVIGTRNAKGDIELRLVADGGGSYFLERREGDGEWDVQGKVGQGTVQSEFADAPWSIPGNVGGLSKAGTSATVNTKSGEFKASHVDNLIKNATEPGALLATRSDGTRRIAVGDKPGTFVMQRHMAGEWVQVSLDAGELQDEIFYPAPGTSWNIPKHLTEAVKPAPTVPPVDVTPEPPTPKAVELPTKVPDSVKHNAPIGAAGQLLDDTDPFHAELIRSKMKSLSTKPDGFDDAAPIQTEENAYYTVFASSNFTPTNGADDTWRGPRTYQSLAAEAWNRTLRAGKPVSEVTGVSPQQKEWIQKAQPALDKLLSESSLIHNVRTWRGMKYSDDILAQLKPGATFEDKGFVSTATKRSVAESFAGGSGIIFDIEVPRGSRGIAPTQWSTRFEEEWELLLPRGSRFEVLEEPKKVGSRTVVKVRAVTDVPDIAPNAVNVDVIETQKPADVVVPTPNAPSIVPKQNLPTPKPTSGVLLAALAGEKPYTQVATGIGPNGSQHRLMTWKFADTGKTYIKHERKPTGGDWEYVAALNTPDKIDATLNKEIFTWSLDDEIAQKYSGTPSGGVPTQVVPDVPTSAPTATDGGIDWSSNALWDDLHEAPSGEVFAHNPQTGWTLQKKLFSGSTFILIDNDGDEIETLAVEDISDGGIAELEETPGPWVKGPKPFAVEPPVAPVTSTPTPGIAHIPDAQRKAWKTTLKANGVGYWSKPEKIWDEVQKIQAQHPDPDKPGHSRYTALQVMMALDSVTKTKDPSPIETKMTKWAATPKGQAYVAQSGGSPLDVPILPKLTSDAAAPSVVAPAPTVPKGLPNYPFVTDAVNVAYTVNNSPNKTSWAEMLAKMPDAEPGQVLGFQYDSSYGGAKQKARFVVKVDENGKKYIDRERSTSGGVTGGDTWFSNKYAKKVYSIDDLTWQLNSVVTSAENAKIVPPKKPKTAVAGPEPLDVTGVLAKGGGESIEHLSTAQIATIYSDFMKKPAGGKVGVVAANLLFADVRETAEQHNLSVLQALKVIDEGRHLADGGSWGNSHAYENAVRAYLKRPEGAAQALGKRPPNAGRPAFAPGVGVESVPSFEESSAFSYDIVKVAEANDIWNAIEKSSSPVPQTNYNAVRAYTGGISGTLNDYLRFKTHTVSDAHRGLIRRIQAAMRPSTQSMLLHRNVGYPAFPGARTREDLEKLIGQTWQSHGFFSTSVGGAAALGGDVSLEVEAPRGTPLVWAKPHSKHPGENEMLLAAGLHYKILSVTPGSYGNRAIVRVRVVPDPDTGSEEEEMNV